MFVKLDNRKFFKNPETNNNKRIKLYKKKGKP